MKTDKILFFYDGKEQEILFDFISDSLDTSIPIKKCKINEKISENFLIQLILLGCDYNCIFKKCYEKFAFLFQNRNIPFAIIRPIILEKNYKFIKGFLLSSFEKYDLTQPQEKILKKIKNSKYYGCSPKQKIHPLNPIFKIMNIQREIVENPYKKFTLYSLSSLASRSPSWVSNKFKEVSGTPLKKFLIKIRYCYALWQVISTEKAIKNIAMEIGYKPPSFSKSFHSMFGLSPSLIRKES